MKQLCRHLRKFATSLSLFAVIAGFGQKVSYNQALEIASDFFNEKGVRSTQNQLHRVKPAGSVADNQAYYIINNGDAFAIVSGDSRVGPILAYSLDAPFDADNIAPGAKYLLQEYEQYIKAVANGEVQAPAPSRIVINQGKLLSTATWNQSPSPWNDLCPVIGTNRAPGGCGATTMSIIMKYNNWPESKGYGSRTYTVPDTDIELTADFGDTDYKISTIPAEGYSTDSWSKAQKEAIATLIYHAGIAANMAYGSDGSGTTNLSALVAMAHYFGYKMGGIINKSSYADVDDYLQLIIDEIDAGYPLPYTGVNPNMGGHMFVCDGYNTDGKLHFNFGWSGSGNGYYYITPETNITSETMSFYQYQGAIPGLRPNRANSPTPDLYMPFGGDYKPVSVDADQINRGKPFTLLVDGLVNTADKTVSMRLAVKIIGADGTEKAVLYQGYSDSSLAAGGSWHLEIPVTIPIEYDFAEGDKICIFDSTDSGASWQQIESYMDEGNSIDITDLYDEEIMVNLQMIQYGSECKGLTLAGGSPISLDGSNFGVTANYLYNNSGYTFSGDIAIFLCDENGQQKQMVGTSLLTGLGNGYLASAWTITCSIPSTCTVSKGDRLIAFCRMQDGDTWYMINCTDADKAYILIPDDLCPTTQTISFNSLMYPFSSNYDLDFTSVTNFNAFSILQQDRETLILQQILELKAGEGALLWGVNDTNGTFTDIASIMETSAIPQEGNLLVGVPQDKVVTNDETDATNYIFRTSAQETGFYFANGETVAAGSAYLRIESSPLNAPMRFAFMVSDDADGIVSISADAPTDNVIYNMQGMRVLRPTPGIYIVNGRKLIIR